MAVPYVAGVVAGKLLDHIFAKRREKKGITAGGSSFGETLGALSGSDSTGQMDQLLAQQREMYAKNMHYTMHSNMEKARFDLSKSILQNLRTG